MKALSDQAAAVLLTALVAFPTVSWAQSVCDGLTTVLNAIDSWDGDEEMLQFFTLPRADCEYDGLGEYLCDWPRPHSGERGAPYRRWHDGVLRETKAFAGKILQCIREGKLPFEWESFETEEDADLVYGYYVYTKDNHRERAIVLCPNLERDHSENSLRLVVRNEHKNYCF